MKRAEIAYIAGIRPKRMDLLRERGQLPFNPPQGDGYTIDHACRLRVMVQLCNLGVRPITAKGLVERGNGDAERVLAILEGSA